MVPDDAKSAEFTGKTIEEAVQNGLASLGLSEEEVEVEVLNPGSRGFLGFRAEEAHVRLTPKAAGSAQVPSVKETPVAERPVLAEGARAVERAKEAGEAVPSAAVAPITPEDAAAAQELLDGLLQRMRVRATVTARVTEPEPDQDAPTLILDISGRDLSALIGRQGETLRSLQYIVRLMVSHRLQRRIHVMVDVEGYKRRREVQLQQLAQRMAERVVLSGRPVVLEAMPPHERRIVHLTLREHPKVTTESVGEEDQRKVTILLRQP